MWPNNKPSYSWGSWTSHNNGNFNVNDQVDWASLAKQWMQHKDVSSTSDLAQQSVEASHSHMWFPPTHTQQHSQFSEKYSTAASQSIGNAASDDLANRNMPAWAVPPPPPPLPPEAGNNAFMDNLQFIEQDLSSIQSFSDVWTQPNMSVFSNKMVNQIRPDLSYSSPWVTNDNSLLDATKRKQLPAWIREGLEKMEREKSKQMEKEILVQETHDNVKDLPQLLHQSEESDKESEMIEDEEKLSENEMKDNSVEDMKILTDEEKIAHLMMKVRRMLTEVLLEVTDDEISSIANSVYHKAKSRQSRAPQTFALSSALASISALGDECESEDEGSGSDGISSSDDDSETFRLKIQKKVAEFEAKMAFLDRDVEQCKGSSSSLIDQHSQVTKEMMTSIKTNSTKQEMNDNANDLRSVPAKKMDGKSSLEFKTTESSSSSSSGSSSYNSSTESNTEKNNTPKGHTSKDIHKTPRENVDKRILGSRHHESKDVESKKKNYDLGNEPSKRRHESTDKKVEKASHIRHSVSTSSRSQRDSHKDDRKLNKGRKDERASAGEKKRQRSGSSSSERMKPFKKDKSSRRDKRHAKRRESKSRSR